MAWDSPYVTVQEFKSELAKQDAKDDNAITRCLATASRQVERYCGRVFNQSEANTVRYFTPAAGTYTIYQLPYPDYVVETEDIVSVAELAIDPNGTMLTYPTVFATTDYYLSPRSVPPGWPYQCIYRMPTGRYSFFPYPDSVKVTGVFGWPAVPDAIKTATMLQAHRLWKRNSSPYGVIGSAELGQLRGIGKMDPDIGLVLAPYMVKTV